MYQSTVILFVIFSVSLHVGKCIVCTPDHCAAVQCLAVENCNGPNQVIKAGGYCNCCNKCFTILGENEPCSELTATIRGSPPPTEECGKGLVCYEGKCQSFKALSKTYV